MSEQLDLFEQPIPDVVTCLTVNQAVRLFVQLYWRRKRMFKGSRTYLNDIVLFFNGRLLHTLTRQDVRNLRTYVAGRGVGASGQNKAHMILTLLINKFEEWREDGWAGGYDISRLMLPWRNPGARVPRVKEQPVNKFMTPLELRGYCKISRQLGFSDIADAIRFGIWAHLAPIDLFALNDDEIDEEAWQIRVFRRHTKTDDHPTGKLQVIEMSEKMWAVINRQRQFRRPDEKRIFPIRNSKRKMHRIRAAAKEMGYRDFSWRHLRKAGPGFLHGKGVHRSTIKEILAHSDQRVTDTHYLPPGDPKSRDAQIMVHEAF